MEGERNKYENIFFISRKMLKENQSNEKEIRY